MPFGDDVDGAVDHFDGGFVVDRVRRTRQPPPQRSALAIVFDGRSSLSTCGKIEKSTIPSVSSPPVGSFHPTKVVPDPGGHHHAPGAQSHPDRLVQRRQQVCQPGLPHPVAQVQGIAACGQQDVGLLDRGTQRSSSMLGRAVSSSTPRDFQPSSHIGQLGSCPLMNCHAFSPGPTQGCPYIAVGMQRALDSPIGLPNRSTSASWMLAFLMPADVRRSFKLPPEFI